MQKSLRISIYTVFGLLWLSGILWLIVHFFFAVPTDFGTTGHPWEAPLLLLHGLIAILSCYTFGWVGARHAGEFWLRGRRRWSGGLLWSVLLLLGLTGFALFFVSNDLWQYWTILLHEIVGVAATVFAVQHWFSGRRA